MNLRPEKEKAAASELVEAFPVVLAPVVAPETEGEEALLKDCRRFTDNCRLFASAFSCWRMNCARD